MSEKVRFTYVAHGGGRPYVAQPLSVELPRWTLSSQFGVDDEESRNMGALLIYKLTRSAA